MKCKKDCKCNECENLSDDWIVYIKQKGLREDRNIVNAFHCTFTGGFAETTKDLKKKPYVDNFIYI